MSNQLTKKQKEVSVIKTTKAMLFSMSKELQNCLPKHLTPERISRISLNELRNNPKLLDCNPESFIGAVLMSCQIGLEPNSITGEAYLIPYGNNVQLQVGYKGLTSLYQRHEKALTLEAHEIRENDDFSFSYGSNKHLKHSYKFTGRGEPVAYYAYAKMKNGAEDFIVMDIDEIKEHRNKYSKGYSSSTSPWKTAFARMAEKTCKIRLLKNLPSSIELQNAVKFDNSVVKYKENTTSMFSLENELPKLNEKNTANKMFSKPDAEIIEPEEVQEQNAEVELNDLDKITALCSDCEMQIDDFINKMLSHESYAASFEGETCKDVKNNPKRLIFIIKNFAKIYNNIK